MKIYFRRITPKFEYRPPRNIPNARSLIVAAYGDPPVRFTFTWRGKSVQLTVPPTYLKADAKDAELVLAGGASSEFPSALMEKLERWDLLELLDILPRNLQVCLEDRVMEE